MENKPQINVLAQMRTEVVKQMESMVASKFVSLPETYKESVFFAMEKLQGMKDIESVPSISITKAFLKMFSNKLDFQKNQCYFFVQNDKDSPTGKSLRFGWQYQGLIFTAKNTCEVSDVFPVLVNENDDFSMEYNSGRLFINKHIPSLVGEIVGGYCVVEKSDGSKLIRYYTKKELDMRKSKSMAPNGNFWAWEREMYEKTLINATLKRLIETNSNLVVDDLYSEPENAGSRTTIETVVINQQEPQQIQQGAKGLHATSAELFEAEKVQIP